MNLDSENLFLKPLSKDEFNGNYINWLNDKEVCKYNSHGDIVYTKDMALDYIESIQDNESLKVYAVYLKTECIHIGNISLQQISKKNKSAEIAYLFGEKPYWNKGYATEASIVLLNHAFNDLKLHRIYFGTNIENIPMQKLGEKLGFIQEGRLKDAQLKNGKFYDIIIYGLIKRDKI